MLVSGECEVTGRRGDSWGLVIRYVDSPCSTEIEVTVLSLLLVLLVVVA